MGLGTWQHLVRENDLPLPGRGLLNIRTQTAICRVKLQFVFRTDLLPSKYLVSTDMALCSERQDTELLHTSQD